jgi:hypothetical protein
MGGKFKPGQSGNPNGRPKGARNKTVGSTRKLLDNAAEKIAEKMIEMALDGDPVALRLCVERIYPKPKEVSIKAALPNINQFSDIPPAVGKIFQMIGEGQFTIEQGKALASIVVSQCSILEMAELEKRIAALEKKDGHQPG